MCVIVDTVIWFNKPSPNNERLRSVSDSNILAFSQHVFSLPRGFTYRIIFRRIAISSVPKGPDFYVYDRSCELQRPAGPRHFSFAFYGGHPTFIRDLVSHCSSATAPTLRLLVSICSLAKAVVGPDELSSLSRQ